MCTITIVANLKLKANVSKPQKTSNSVIPRSSWIFKLFMHKVKIRIVEAINRPGK